MFLGHFGIGFGAKAAAPKTSLGTLFFAAQFVDLLWPTLLLLGLEHVEIAPGITRVTPLDFVHYPISHSLITALMWGILFGVIYGLARWNLRGAAICSMAVISHWILDFITHRPDLPLLPRSPGRVGLGLWNSLWGTIMVEGLIFAIGIYLYLRITQARDKVGSVGLWSLIVFLILIHIGNLFGDPPPSVDMIAYVGHAQWLLVLWGYWIDRHRDSVSNTEEHHAPI
jgi:uncharacterized membrane protein